MDSHTGEEGFLNQPQPAEEREERKGAQSVVNFAMLILIFNIKRIMEREMPFCQTESYKMNMNVLPKTYRHVLSLD